MCSFLLHWEIWAQGLSLRSGCHLGSEEDLIVPSKEIQGKPLFSVIANQKAGIKLEMLVWRVRYLRKLEFKI